MTKEKCAYHPAVMAAMKIVVWAQVCFILYFVLGLILHRFEMIDWLKITLMMIVWGFGVVKSIRKVRCGWPLRACMPWIPAIVLLAVWTWFCMDIGLSKAGLRHSIVYKQHVLALMIGVWIAGILPMARLSERVRAVLTSIPVEIFFLNALFAVMIGNHMFYGGYSPRAALRYVDFAGIVAPLFLPVVSLTFMWHVKWPNVSKAYRIGRTCLLLGAQHWVYSLFTPTF